VTGPDGTDSQADSAGSIPVTRSSLKAQVRGLTVSPGLTSRGSSYIVRAINQRGPVRRSARSSSSPRFACSAWTCVSIASVILLSAPRASCWSRRRRCAAPLARRQRRALPWETRSAHAGPHAQTRRRSTRLICLRSPQGSAQPSSSWPGECPVVRAPMQRRRLGRGLGRCRAHAKRPAACPARRGPGRVPRPAPGG
jgi:hypothetical protein